VVVLEERTMASLAVLVAYGGGRKKKREVCMRERENNGIIIHFGGMVWRRRSDHPYS
jgi:hypothetical protein